MLDSTTAPNAAALEEYYHIFDFFVVRRVFDSV